MSIIPRSSAAAPGAAAERLLVDQAATRPLAEAAPPSAASFALAHPIRWALGHTLATVGKTMLEHPRMSAAAAHALYLGAWAVGLTPPPTTVGSTVVFLATAATLLNPLTMHVVGEMSFDSGLKSLSQAIDDHLFQASIEGNPGKAGVAATEQARVSERYSPTWLRFFARDKYGNRCPGEGSSEGPTLSR